MFRLATVVRFHKVATRRAYAAKGHEGGPSHKAGRVSESVKEHAEEAKEELRKRSEVVREQVEKKAEETKGDPEAVSIDEVYDTARDIKDKVIDTAKSGASTAQLLQQSFV